MERRLETRRLSEKGRGGVTTQRSKTRTRNGDTLASGPRNACFDVGPVHISLLVNKLVRRLESRLKRD